MLVGCDRLWNIDKLGAPDADARLDTLENGGDGTMPDCPGYMYQPVTGTSYMLMTTPNEWANARIVCYSTTTGPGWHGHLAVINSQTEYTALWAMLSVQNAQPWVGAFDAIPTNTTDEFRWVTDDPSTTLLWAPAQPDQLDVQQCAYMKVPEGMDNEICDGAPRAFLCECDSYSDTEQQ